MISVVGLVAGIVGWCVLVLGLCSGLCKCWCSPGVVAQQVLSLRLGEQKRKQYESCWERLREWMEDKGEAELGPEVLNEYIARKCTGMGSDYLARHTRASAVWLCELARCALPCDRITWKLVEGIKRSSKLGVSVILSVDQVILVSGSPGSKVKWWG